MFGSESQRLAEKWNCCHGHAAAVKTHHKVVDWVRIKSGVENDNGVTGKPGISVSGTVVLEQGLGPDFSNGNLSEIRTGCS